MPTTPTTYLGAARVTVHESGKAFDFVFFAHGLPCRVGAIHFRDQTNGVAFPVARETLPIGRHGLAVAALFFVLYFGAPEKCTTHKKGNTIEKSKTNGVGQRAHDH